MRNVLILHEKKLPFRSDKVWQRMVEVLSVS